MYKRRLAEEKQQHRSYKPLKYIIISIININIIKLNINCIEYNNNYNLYLCAIS
jgi:hypothetical protein